MLTHSSGRLQAKMLQKYVKTSQNMGKVFNIVEFQYHIWNHREKCTQISINMPSIGSAIHEISGENYKF